MQLHSLSFDVSHTLAGGLVLISFMMLYQDRLYSLLNVFALHALVLALSVAWQAYVQNAPHLYITAAIALVFKAIIIPVALHRIVKQLGIHRDIESAVGIGPTMLAGMGLVALSMVLMLRVTADADPLAREDLAFALSVVLLGLLVMVTRRNAVSQVVGFMSLENGLVLAATGAKGMPLVVEISVAFSILIAFIVIGIFLFRIRERFELCGRFRTRRLSGRAAMSIHSFDPVAAVLLIPIGAAALLAILPGYRLTARLNVVASLATFLAALSLFVIERPQPGPYVLVDDLNIVFIVLNTFVGFTTSIFSASYIAHELETGRLTPVYLRFYHAMYQTMMFGMNLAFVSNNIGLMWVAVEIATLTTVLMVGIYRTHAALEAAWKYFILGSVGIAFALFGTILVYMAARPVVGEGQDGMVWTILIEHAANFDPSLLNVAFIFLFLGYGTKVGLAPLHAWLPDAHAEGPTPDIGGAVGVALECRALRAAALQDIAGRKSCSDRSRPADGDDRPGVGSVRSLHALPPTRHQTAVRLFLDRAHGHHRVRVRDGRSARQFCRAVAHGDAQPDQVRDLLCGRPYFADQGHAADLQDPRPDGDPSGARLESGDRGRRDHRLAAARHFHERISGRQFNLCAGPPARGRLGIRASACLWRIDLASDQRRIRQTSRQRGVGGGLLCADVCASVPGSDRWHLSSSAAGHLVPARGSPSWIG